MVLAFEMSGLPVLQQVCTNTSLASP